MDNDRDPNASPLETSSFECGDVCSTPDTEFSGPVTIPPKQSSQKDRIWAADKVSQLTQEEKVRFPPYMLNKVGITLLIPHRSHCLPLRTSGGPRQSVKKVYQRQKRAMDPMAPVEGFLLVARG